MNLESKLHEVLEMKDAVRETIAYKRLSMLFDKGSMIEFDTLVKSEGGLAEVVTAYGTVEGLPVYAFAQDGDVAGGAISKAQAGKIKKIYNFASKTGAPVVGIYDSQGARLKEGGEILAAYGDMLLWSSSLSGVVPQISVVAGTCVGTNALIAASADIVIAAQGTDFGIETNGSEKKVEDVADSVHILAGDVEDALKQARKLITMLPSNNLGVAPKTDYAEPTVTGAELDAVSASVGTDTRIISYITTGVIDAGSLLDLQPKFGRSVLTGLATIEGSTVGIVASRSRNDGGKIDADSAAKAARFVRFCDAFSIPIVTLVDTYGFESVRDAAKVAHAYAEATTVKLAVIVGSVYGPAFVSMAGRAANADLTVAWPNAVIAPLAPETFAAIMYGDKLKGADNPAKRRIQIVQEYKDTLASPAASAADGYVDDVIAPADTRAVVASALEMLASKKVTRLPKKHSNIQL